MSETRFLRLKGDAGLIDFKVSDAITDESPSRISSNLEIPGEMTEEILSS